MINPTTESLPFKPLKKIEAPIVITHTPLKIGDKVDIIHKHGVWRTFEVTVLDGEICRLVTLDKRFHRIQSIASVLQLRDLQRRN